MNLERIPSFGLRIANVTSKLRRPCVQPVRTVAKSLDIPHGICRHRFDSRIAFAVTTLRYDPLDHDVLPRFFAAIQKSP